MRKGGPGVSPSAGAALSVDNTIVTWGPPPSSSAPSVLYYDARYQRWDQTSWTEEKDIPMEGADAAEIALNGGVRSIGYGGTPGENRTLVSGSGGQHSDPLSYGGSDDI